MSVHQRHRSPRRRAPPAVTVTGSGTASVTLDRHAHADQQPAGRQSQRHAHLHRQQRHSGGQRHADPDCQRLAATRAPAAR
ncbi:MAG: hypothetical protein MZV64_19975 [Ignavibacteriales bacterium]|nr:hypothetical protein [Ignavibacteriales bacterium]